MTFTENVQLAPAASAAPERLTDEVPAVAAMVPAPQLPFSPLGVETTNPEGKVSVKLIPVSVAGLPVGLLTIKLKEVEPPSGMVVRNSAHRRSIT